MAMASYKDLIVKSCIYGKVSMSVVCMLIQALLIDFSFESFKLFT